MRDPYDSVYDGDTRVPDGVFTFVEHTSADRIKHIKDEYNTRTFCQKHYRGPNYWDEIPENAKTWCLKCFTKLQELRKGEPNEKANIS